MSVNPRIEEVPAWVSVGVRQVARMDELSTVFPAAYERVSAASGAAGGQLVGPAYARYFGMPRDTVDVEIGFGVAGPIDVPGLVVTQNPAFKAAIGTHVGPYAALPDAYGELMTWIGDQQVRTTDEMFEFYDSMPDELPESTVTRMVFPLAS